MEKAERDHARAHIPKLWKSLEIREMLMANIVLVVLLSIATVAFVFEAAPRMKERSKNKVAELKEERHSLIKVSSISNS